MAFFDDKVSRTIYLGLASNHNPPDFCLLSGWDYRREPPEPGLRALESEVKIFSPDPTSDLNLSLQLPSCPLIRDLGGITNLRCLQPSS
jgi:hypothetical protein